jgi:hypothetical protein
MAPNHNNSPPTISIHSLMASPTTHDLDGGIDNAILMEIELPIPFNNSNHNNIECWGLGLPNHCILVSNINANINTSATILQL